MDAGFKARFLISGYLSGEPEQRFFVHILRFAKYNSRMFCPKCGKDNTADQRFCAGCGTNLEAISVALTGREEDFFTKFDVGMDQFIARYADHVFTNAGAGIADHKVARSWRILGQGVVTTFVDILLFTLMWNVLPLRFLLLLISTPFRLLSERSRQQSTEVKQQIEDYRPPELAEPASQLWLGDAAASVTDRTTELLETPSRSGRHQS